MFVGAYWGKRKETRDECAKRIADVLQRLGENHPALGTWYQKARSKSAAMKNTVELSPGSIGRILRTNTRDTDGSPIAELGFSIGVWNGNDELPASFSATCGGYSDFVKNSAVLDFDPSWDYVELVTSGRLRTVLVDLVKALDPDKAVVTSHEYLDRAGVDDPCDAGWLVYERNRGVHQIIEHGNLGQVD